MKYLIILLLLASLSGFGQGMQVAVYSPTLNSWVYRNVYETNNPPTTVTGNCGTATALQNARTINGVSFNGTANITVTADATTLTGASLNASVAVAQSQVTNLATSLAAKQGISVAATSATTGTITTPMTSATQTVYTITPTGSCTFNATGGTPGAVMTFVITTSGTSSFTLTWGTNFKTTATLATGTTTAKTFCVSFVCTNATPTWVETGRTVAM